MHGCFDELADLAREIGHSSDDEWILVGDLLNKGPDSRGVLDWARANGVRTILGNHEARFLDAAAQTAGERSGKDRKILESVGEGFEPYAEWIRTWPLWIEWPDVLTVHAGLEPGVAELAQMRRKVLLTIRSWDGAGENLDREGDPAWHEIVQWPVPIVHGHWAAKGLVDLPHCKGLDTGCVYGGKLTAWSPDEDRFWQVSARREYIPFKD